MTPELAGAIELVVLLVVFIVTVWYVA